MPLVFSPSSLSTFKTCPLRFCGQSIVKDISWSPSKQKSRGTVMHTEMEKALRLGWQDVNKFDNDVDMAYVRQVVSEVQKHIANGYKLYVEHEMCITKKGIPVDWWNRDGYLRAKADVLLLHSDKPAIVGDIKTGRKWDDEDMQLRIECLLAHIIYKKPVVQYAYWYIDQGETVDGIIDFRNGLAPVQDIFDLMNEAGLAIRNGYYPAQRNKFCKWCSYNGTEKCK